MSEISDLERIADQLSIRGAKVVKDGRRYNRGNGLIAAAATTARNAGKHSHSGIDPHRADKALRRFSWEDGE